MYAVAHAFFGFAVCYIARMPVVTGVMASLLPDIDALFHFSFPFVHRGVFHTPVAAVVVGTLVFSISGRRASGFAVCAGWISHLVLDTMTPSGVMWLYPIRTEISLSLALAASLTVNIGLAAVSIIFSWLWRCRWRWLRFLRR